MLLPLLLSSPWGSKNHVWFRPPLGPSRLKSTKCLPKFVRKIMRLLKAQKSPPDLPKMSIVRMLEPKTLHLGFILEPFLGPAAKVRIELSLESEPSGGPPGRPPNGPKKGSSFGGPSGHPFLVSWRLEKKKVPKWCQTGLPKGGGRKSFLRSFSHRAAFWALGFPWGAPRSLLVPIFPDFGTMWGPCWCLFLRFWRRCSQTEAQES